MKAYRTKLRAIPGTDFHEVRKKADAFYQAIRRRTKRRPYVRSAYFRKEKIFLGLYWQHLFDKQKWQDRMRRLRFLPAAIDLIKNSRVSPSSKENPNNPNEILHRFCGMTGDDEVFYVQIKEDKRSGQKFLISTFPER